MASIFLFKCVFQYDCVLPDIPTLWTAGNYRFPSSTV